jgi:hypothetical protein
MNYLIFCIHIFEFLMAENQNNVFYIQILFFISIVLLCLMIMSLWSKWNMKSYSIERGLISRTLIIILIFVLKTNFLYYWRKLFKQSYNTRAHCILSKEIQNQWKKGKLEKFNQFYQTIVLKLFTADLLAQTFVLDEKPELPRSFTDNRVWIILFYIETIFFSQLLHWFNGYCIHTSFADDG